MATSSVPTAIDALIALIEGLSQVQADPDVQVADAYPGPGSPDKIIAVGGTVSPTAEIDEKPAQLGAQRRVEEYKIQVIVSVYGGRGVEQQAARTEAYLLFGAIETALREPPGANLSGAVNFAQIGPHDLRQTSVEDAQQGCIAEITAWVLVRAFI